MAVGGNLFGLSAEAKARLLQKLSSVASGRPGAALSRRREAAADDGGSDRLDVSELKLHGCCYRRSSRGDLPSHRAGCYRAEADPEEN